MTRSFPSVYIYTPGNQLSDFAAVYTFYVGYTHLTDELQPFSYTSARALQRENSARTVRGLRRYYRKIPLEIKPFCVVKSGIYFKAGSAEVLKSYADAFFRSVYIHTNGFGD